MAVTTVTSTAAVASVEPRLVHAGVNVVNVKFVHSGTVGDIILMAKIPTGVDIVGIYGKITTAETAANATVGIQGDVAIFGSLASGGSPVFPTIGANKTRISVSDDATNRFAYLVVSPTSATWTISATIDLTCLYTAINQS
jgi:hypothetical protein